MKKLYLITIIAVTAVISASVATAATKLTLIVNGQVAAVEPLLIDGTTYVPLRAAAEMLGSDVNYDGATGTIQINKKGASLVDSYKVGDWVFTQLQVEESAFGWSASVEAANTAKASKSANFTVVFYDDAGNRVGSGFGNLSTVAAGTSKYATIVTTDDLTGYATVKFQIDIEFED